MGIFFDMLREEHRKIKSLLEEFKMHRKSIELTGAVEIQKLRAMILSLHSLVEETHHPKEEKILFPAIERLAIPNQGGPRCTEFMDIKLAWDPAGAILSRVPEFNLSLAVPPQHMLSIPLEEHAAGHIALQLLPQAVLQASQSEDARKVLCSLMRDYELLMDVHIRKEDECLFVLADGSMDETTQREMMHILKETRK